MTLINTGGGGPSSFMYGPNFTLNAQSDHFDSSTLDPKWTVDLNTMGNSYDINTTVKSALVCKPTATGQSLNLSQVVSHTGDVSYVVSCAGGANTNFTSLGIVLYNSVSDTDGVMVDLKFSTGFKLGMSQRTGGTWSFDNVVYTFPEIPSLACFLIQRKGTTWKMGVGQHPYGIFPVSGSITKSIGTIVRLELNLNSSGNVAPWSVDSILRDYIYVP